MLAIRFAHHMLRGHIHILSCLICGLACLFLCCTLQSQPTQQPTGKKIEILNADRASFDSRVSKDAQMLVGNVRLMHREVVMSCDSALLYQAANRLEAFGNVHLNQGDTLHLYGDSLFYNGNNRMGRVQGKVRLTEKDMELTSDHLLYDTRKSIAYYTTGGRIISRKNKNVLTSTRGTYDSKLKTFYFKDLVKLENPEYTVNTDTMHYQTQTEVAYFFGPTVIRSAESMLYAENGWYNTKKDLASFKENAFMVSGDQKLQGDSLYYDGKLGVGQVFKNIVITDTVNDFLVYGDYGIHFEKNDSSMITLEPRAIKIFEDDSLFMKADTILALEDTLGLSSLLGFHGVRFFSQDVQGICDTLLYQEKDSSLTLLHDPILWNEENQLTGNKIVLYSDGEELDELFIDRDALIVELVDTIYSQYNQLQGRSLHGDFENSELVRVDITGNGRSIYYATEVKADSTVELVGINKVESSDITILLQDNEIRTVTFLVQPTAVTLPPTEVGKPDLLLKGFRWEEGRRPRNRQEIMDRKSN